MNRESIELVKQFIAATVTGDNTISPEAYKLLTYLLQTDRTFAVELSEIYDLIERSGGRYGIIDVLDSNEGYEV